MVSVCTDYTQLGNWPVTVRIWQSVDLSKGNDILVCEFSIEHDVGHTLGEHSVVYKSECCTLVYFVDH